jgi:hypothetical protein
MTTPAAGTFSADLGSPDDQSPTDQDCAEEIRHTVQKLVALDIRFGGDRTSAIALRALASAHRDRHRRGVRQRAERDVRAAVAELAEVTGWLLCDAHRHALSRQVNRQALSLARRAGDRSMELFVIHNLSLQATYLRRPNGLWHSSARSSTVAASLPG